MNCNYQLLIGDDSPENEHGIYFKNTKNVTVLHGTGDLYWGGTVNLCLNFLHKQVQPSSEDIIIFANNDTIIDQNTFPPISTKLQEVSEAIFHSRVFNLEKKEIQSGGILKSWIPIRCSYPINFKEEVIRVDMITGRFLAMKYKILKKIGNIADNLPHYAGDNDFSLRAKSMGIPTFLIRDSICYVDETTSGIKINSSMNIRSFFKSMRDIKSTTNMKYKYRLIRNHNSLFFSLFAIQAEFLKTCYKFLERKIIGIS